MATVQNKRKTTTKRGSMSGRSNVDKAKWFSGFILTLVGFFAFVSVVFYYFNWKSDYDMVTRTAAERSELVAPSVPDNPCGILGAWLAEQIVGRSFGAVGIIIPLFLIIIGARLLKRSPLRLNYTALSMVLLLLCGSSTLGFIFKSNWGVFNTGLGGVYGIQISDIVTGSLGPIGMILLLIGLWIATGIFINSNFIDTVNSASSAALDSGGRFVNIVKGNAALKRERREARREEERLKREAEGQVESDPQEYEEDDDDEAEDDDDEAYDDGEEIVEEQTEQQEADDAEEEQDAEEEASDEDFERLVQEHLTDDEGDASGSADGGVVVTVESNEDVVVSEDEAETELYDPLKDLHNYTKPPVSLLEDYKSKSEVTDDEIFANKTLIEDTLKYFGIPIIKIKATVGPTITLYEILQAQGVKISKIQGLENDIAQSLKAETGIRIIAPIPGRGTIGIEVPNLNKQVVSMYSSILSQKFQEMRAELPIVVGRTIQNESYVFDLAKMPHLLVAGATGQGKSVGLNAIIASLLYRKHPSQLKFVMIDPKMVEFTPYKHLEHHFMAKMESEEDVIITDPKKAVNTLNALCEEMEKRLRLLSDATVRNITEYNAKFVQRRLRPDKGHFYMPYIVVIVDEFADLIMMSREVETPVMRLAQKARAVGIHLIIATQRPDVKVITGGIKANFPARIAFRVMQMIDSRTIIDQPGANQLIGRGDMLFKKDGDLIRIQCALVETDEVERIVKHISEQQGYPNPYFLPDYVPEGGGDTDFGDSGAPIKYDQLFAEIARAAVSGGGISTSAIQRNYEVGFNRAGRIMTQLEKAGIVGRQEGAKPREILFYDLQSLEAKLQSLGLF
ncbi:MAG: DNA translocase FtsK 4TM domain-containing protein [Rikenellaceae bacterium]